MHPHQHFLDELEYAIKHLVSTIDPKIKEEAEQLHAKLEANPETDVADIRAALVELGKKEWPARHAFEEVGEKYQDKFLEMFFARLEPLVKEKFESLMAGGTVEDVTASDMFEEQFTPEERYHVEEGLIEARLAWRDMVGEEIDKTDKMEYDEAFKKWSAKQQELEGLLAELRDMAGKDEKLADEIMDKVDTYQEGWSIVERDFDEEDLKGQIDYYQGVLGLREE